MGLGRLSLIIGIFLVIFAVLYQWEDLFGVRDSPLYTIDVKYFGSAILSSNHTEDLTIRTFKIPFERSQTEDLNQRLSKTRFYEPDIIIDKRYVNQPIYGFKRKTAEIIRDYWIKNYDWKKTVEELNTFNHYKTRISGLDIHFVRITQNSNKQAILFLHGWPSSFIEYLDVTRLFNSSTNSNYDLIIPSLPSFGYSDAPVRSGLTSAQIAVIMHNLMQRIGYDSYVICGGDWGSMIGTHMAQLYPNYIQGLLLTFAPPIRSLRHDIQSILGYYLNPSLILDNDEKDFLLHRFDPFEYLKFFWYEGGYMHLQSTKPDTIGYALNDSPLGLASYILEKWSRWSNNETDIENSNNSGLDRFTLDQLLSNIMLYWTTGTITSSMRTYFEEMSSALSGHNQKLLNGPLSKSVPVGIINYRYEVIYTPRIRAKIKYPNIKLWLFHNEGGHFAAIEKPKEYFQDIQRFLREL